MKSLTKWIVLALCLSGCSGTMNKEDETNKADHPIINNAEIINQEDISSDVKNNEKVSFSESNQERFG